MMTAKTRRWLLASLVLAVAAIVTQSNVHAAKKYYVDFRSVQWKTAHYNNPQVAEERFKTLQSLQCDVQKFAHNGHTDVKYRQAKWRVLSFDTDEEAHKWQHWLKTMGFETRHEH